MFTRMSHPHIGRKFLYCRDLEGVGGAVGSCQKASMEPGSAIGDANKEQLRLLF